MIRDFARRSPSTDSSPSNVKTADVAIGPDPVIHDDPRLLPFNWLVHGTFWGIQESHSSHLWQFIA